MYIRMYKGMIEDFILIHEKTRADLIFCYYYYV